MSKSLSPSEVVNALMEGISNERWELLHDFYAEDAVVDYPFALPAPRRLEGRAAIQKYFSIVATAPLKLQTRNMVIHLTSDSETVVAEWDYDGLVRSTGRSFHISNIQVTKVRAGKIITSRDYHNHALLAAVMGQLPSVAAALGKTIVA